MAETESIATRIKRLRMRSMRRGIKEMDIILSGFAETHLSDMPESELNDYDRLLGENDQDLYAWVSGQFEAPPELSTIVLKIKTYAYSR